MDAAEYWGSARVQIIPVARTFRVEADVRGEFVSDDDTEGRRIYVQAAAATRWAPTVMEGTSTKGRDRRFGEHTKKALTAKAHDDIKKNQKRCTAPASGERAVALQGLERGCRGSWRK